MFTGRRIRVILNPSSGTERGQSLAGRIEQAIAEAGPLTLELSITGGADDATNWARQAADDGFDLVLAAGGDGSVTAVAHGVLQSEKRPALGIIPLGTGNGLARVLGLPVEPLAAVKALREGRLVELDVLDVPSHNTTSLLFLGAGLDAEINKDADSHNKARLGFLAYVQATFRHLSDRQNHQVEMVVDGQPRSVAAHTISVFNATHLNLFGAEVGPDSHPHDGVANLSVMSAPGFWKVMGQVLSVVGRNASRPRLERIRELEFTAEPPMLVHVDGDVVGETPVKLSLKPAALRFIAAAGYRIPH